MRWVVSSYDGQCHAVEPVDVELAAGRGYVEALCGHRMPSAGVDPMEAPGGVVCIACAIGATTDMPDPGRFGTAR